MFQVRKFEEPQFFHSIFLTTAKWPIFIRCEPWRAKRGWVFRDRRRFLSSVSEHKNLSGTVKSWRNECSPPLRWRALVRETLEAHIICAVVRIDFFLGMEKIFYEVGAPQLPWHVKNKFFMPVLLPLIHSVHLNGSLFSIITLRKSPLIIMYPPVITCIFPSLLRRPAAWSRDLVWYI